MSPVMKALADAAAAGLKVSFEQGPSPDGQPQLTVRTGGSWASLVLSRLDDQSEVKVAALIWIEIGHFRAQQAHRAEAREPSTVEQRLNQLCIDSWVTARSQPAWIGLTRKEMEEAFGTVISKYINRMTGEAIPVRLIDEDAA